MKEFDIPIMIYQGIMAFIVFFYVFLLETHSFSPMKRFLLLAPPLYVGVFGIYVHKKAFDYFKLKELWSVG